MWIFRVLHIFYNKTALSTLCRYISQYFLLYRIVFILNRDNSNTEQIIFSLDTDFNLVKNRYLSFHNCFQNKKWGLLNEFKQNTNILNINNILITPSFKFCKTITPVRWLFKKIWGKNYKLGKKFLFSFSLLNT